MREKSPRGDGHRLQEQLVAAASKLLVSSQGFQAPSLRAVARECGVSPSAVYLHFGSQVELARAVVVAQFDQLRLALTSADDSSQTPHQRLIDLGRAYMDWAVENPGGYQLLFDTPDVEAPAGRSWAPGLDLLGMVIERFRELGHEGETADRLGTLAWASWHGLISLRRNKPTAPWMRSLEEDAQLVIAALRNLSDAAIDGSGR